MENTAIAAPDAPVSFNDLLGNNQLLIEPLTRLSITVPTPVQARVIPLALQGRDIIAQAKTGSGKTLAFVLPLLQRLLAASQPNITQALVVTPTRELANQIVEVFCSLSQEIHPACLIGGVSFGAQIQDLNRDRRVLVGTPGRILDMLRQREINLRRCSYFVIDEADEMFSMDFVEDVRAILSRLPEERQGVFVSATITPRVEALANNFLYKPERLIVSAEGEDLPSIEHRYCEVGGDISAKANALCDLLETTKPRSAIIFCNTKSDTELVEKYLRRRGFDARLINSDLNQRQREVVMAKIKNQELRFLVGTDIAARGIDISELEMVFNYAIPEQHEVYIHRTGRTGRAGKSGRAISLVGPQDFGPFTNLKRHVPVELLQLALPSEDEVIAARLAHFYEIVRGLQASPQAREQLLTRKLLKDLSSIEDPSEELTSLVAKLYHFVVEHVITHEALSLDGEESAPQSVRSTDSSYSGNSHHSGPQQRSNFRHSRHGGGRDDRRSGPRRSGRR